MTAELPSLWDPVLQDVLVAPRIALTLSEDKAAPCSVSCQLAPTVSCLEKVLRVAVIVTSLDVACYFFIFYFFRIAMIQLVLLLPLLFLLSGDDTLCPFLAAAASRWAQLLPLETALEGFLQFGSRP